MPIDVSYPTTLLSDILSDAQPVVVCVEEALADNLPGNLMIPAYHRILPHSASPWRCQPCLQLSMADQSFGVTVSWGHVHRLAPY